MATKEKLRLRKELDKFHPFARGWVRQDLTSGRWLAQFLERHLASHLGGRTPPELEREFPDAEDDDELAELITTRAIHAGIAATDAYVENLTGTEVRNLKDKSLKGSTKLTGDTVAMVAELLYVIKICIDLMFDVTSAHKRVFTGGEIDLVTEILARSLGHFDVDAARESGKFHDKVGAKVFERSIAASVGKKVADALRKGFYCFIIKAIANVVPEYLDNFEAWTEPQAETGPMLSVDPAEVDDPLGFQT